MLQPVHPIRPIGVESEDEEYTVELSYSIGKKLAYDDFGARLEELPDELRSNQAILVQEAVQIANKYTPRTAVGLYHALAQTPTLLAVHMSNDNLSLHDFVRHLLLWHMVEHLVRPFKIFLSFSLFTTILEATHD